MLAVDTNVVVRYLTRDHPEQAARAKALIDSSDIFIATTVLLETEWVLRSAYRLPRDRIGAAIRAFARLPRVTLEDPVLASKALNWFVNGMDFADALHLAGTEQCAGFVSFDRDLVKLARRMGRATVTAP